MLTWIENLVKNKKFCVLATCADQKPHCSLMAYHVDDNCRHIQMITHMTTRKYINIIKNPNVSLLVDTRDAPGDSVQALTIEGLHVPIKEDQDQHRLREAFLSIHPHMSSFAHHADAKIIRFRIRSFLLLTGLTDTYFYNVS